MARPAMLHGPYKIDLQAIQQLEQKVVRPQQICSARARLPVISNTNIVLSSQEACLPPQME